MGQKIEKTHGAAIHTDVTRELFLPVNEGQVAAGTPDSVGYFAVVTGGPDLNEPYVYFTMEVPDNFVSFTSVKARWICGSSPGNMYWQLQADYAACGEGYNTHTDAPALGVTATGGMNIINCQEPANPLTLANLVLGDLIGIMFYRNGVHANDTLDDFTHLLGLLFTYVGHQ